MEAFDLLRANLSLLSKVTKTETRPFRTDFILLSHWRKKKNSKSWLSLRQLHVSCRLMIRLPCTFGFEIQFIGLGRQSYEASLEHSVVNGITHSKMRSKHEYCSMVVYNVFKSVRAGTAMQLCVNCKDFSEYTYNDVLHFESAGTDGKCRAPLYSRIWGCLRR